MTDWRRTLPKSIRFGPRSLAISLRSHAEAIGHGYMGSSLVCNDVILIDESLSYAKAVEVVWHETRHHLWSEFGLGETETEERVIEVVTAAECWLYAANPKLFAWISRGLASGASC